MQKLEEETLQKEDKNAPNLSDYLQSPKKKRKQFAVMAFASTADPDLIGVIETFIRKQYPQLAVAYSRQAIDFQKQINKNIALILMDDEFVYDEGGMTLLHALKNKRHADTIPTLFLTKDPDNLISNYTKELKAYQETDEYLDIRTATRQRIFGRIKSAIETKNKRRSRRYSAHIPLQFFHLERGKQFSGELLDMSLHGCLIETKDDCTFRVGDQVKIMLPTMGILPITKGEFFKLSGKIRRVYISGDRAGVSFEYLSEQQQLTLSRYVTKLFSLDLERKSLNSRLNTQKVSRP